MIFAHRSFLFLPIVVWIVLENGASSEAQSANAAVEKGAAQEKGEGPRPAASRPVEAQAPSPSLGQAPPASRWGVGVEPAAEGWNLSAGDFRIALDSRSGALRSWETDSGQWLAAPGGVNYAVAPGARRLGPGGAVSNARQTAEGVEFDWAGEGLKAHYQVSPHQGYITWEVRIPNAGDDNLLVETRLSLPARLGSEFWFYWDGLSLRQLAAGSPPTETTTVKPGRYFSQGIFPAVCLHNGKVGMAAGLFPTDIESFYGSRAQGAGDSLETFYYVVRMAIPPRQERRVTFVLYATDPNWSWRSLVDRYWSFWPEWFAAPQRDDVWGLYALTQPWVIEKEGDKFIDLCRRFHVGAMELSTPFSRTGDFYAEQEPAYWWKDFQMSREELRRVYEIANLACCNLSYTIPMNCEREMALSQYADSVCHELNGKAYVRDDWSVLGPGREKLAAMFAWGDSFAEHVRRDLRRIADDYKPCGFYMDLGAVNKEDWGRMTEWAAFDDAGRVYTNIGVVFAKLLDDVADFAPGLQRNPGEELQYFSGFRAQSQLSNHTRFEGERQPQPFYLRTHRLIMGRKPIYPGVPRGMDKSILYDALEFGGLPWLGIISFDRLTPWIEQLLKREDWPMAIEWGPVAIALARAGWDPIPQAAADKESVRIERFGADPQTFFTVRNLADQPARVELRLTGLYPRLSEFRNRVPLNPKMDEAKRVTSLSMSIPADELIVLRAEPAPEPSEREWPKVDFLANAEPLSIVAPSNADSFQRVTRGLKGFVELQAELLGKSAEVEIVSDAAKAKFPHRVIVKTAPEFSFIADGPNAAVLSGPDESSLRRLLGEYLKTIELPLTKQPPLQTLATPLP
ncbi:MAG: hypothetical protein NTW86_07345 [Candidatus Sumerlaeota bacterium]|nr:hypothetical protein [Candidatus Sumerlaeota bacterium]